MNYNGLTDDEVKQRLLDRDVLVTRWFLYEKCRPLITAIGRRVFKEPRDYHDLANELYLLLMEDGGRRLLLHDGRSTLLQWLKTVALRHFLRIRHKEDGWETPESQLPSPKKDNGEKGADVIDNATTDSLYPIDSLTPDGTEEAVTAAMDVQRLLLLMPTRRRAYVVQRLLIDGAEPQAVAKELNVTVANLYNIKKRAMNEFTRVALADIKTYKR